MKQNLLPGFPARLATWGSLLLLLPGGASGQVPELRQDDEREILKCDTEKEMLVCDFHLEITCSILMVNVTNP